MQHVLVGPTQLDPAYRGKIMCTFPINHCFDIQYMVAVVGPTHPARHGLLTL